MGHPVVGRPVDRAFVSVGRLGAPKGVRGDLKVHSYSGESAHFRKLKVVELRPEGAMFLGPDAAVPLGAAGGHGAKAPPAAVDATTAAAPAARKALSLKVVRVEGEGSSLTMAFEGYASPEAARVLTGMEIIVPRSAASPLQTNQWYIDDLVGLLLIDAGGAALATVEAVLEGGAEPWLEVAVPAAAAGAAAGSERRGGLECRRDLQGRHAIVPFRKEFVGAVDVERGTIELLAPELLDE